MGRASNSKKKPGARVADARQQQAGSTWFVRAALASVVALGVLIVVVSSGDRREGGGEPAAPEGTEEFEVAAASHVSQDVEYPQTPPAGGDHDPAWQNCGSYREPVLEENAVHSLEHGTVWITYQPDLAEDAVEALEGRAEGETHVLVTPFEGLDDPVVLSAWGRQLRVGSAEDGRIDAFVRAFQQGPQTPELGATCSGAIGEPR